MCVRVYLPLLSLSQDRRVFETESFFIGFLAMGVAVSAAHARGLTECTLKYNLKGWSAFYKTARGQERSAATVVRGPRCDVPRAAAA